LFKGVQLAYQQLDCQAVQPSLQALKPEVKVWASVRQFVGYELSIRLSTAGYVLPCHSLTFVGRFFENVSPKKYFRPKKLERGGSDAELRRVFSVACLVLFVFRQRH
jgi:hypothetical protein